MFANFSLSLAKSLFLHAHCFFVIIGIICHYWHYCFVIKKLFCLCPKLDCPKSSRTVGAYLMKTLRLQITWPAFYFWQFSIQYKANIGIFLIVEHF